MIITDKSISEFINKSLLTDKIENSELKTKIHQYVLLEGQLLTQETKSQKILKYI